jgi:hypothetical protein
MFSGRLKNGLLSWFKQGVEVASAAALEVEKPQRLFWRFDLPSVSL